MQYTVFISIVKKTVDRYMSSANACQEACFTYLLICCNICCVVGLCNFVLIYIVWNVL